MVPAQSARVDGHHGLLRRAASFFADRAEATIGVRAREPGRRRRLSALCGGLILAGLACAMLTPLLGGLGYGLAAILAFALLGSAALAGAAVIAFTGEAELVAAAFAMIAAAALASLAVEIDSFWPLLLVLVAPVEARLARRELLFRMTLPAVFLAAGLAGFLSLHGLGPSDQGFAGTVLALPLATAYGAFVLHRLAVRGGPAPARAEAAAAAGPAVAIDAEGRIVAGEGRGTSFAQRLHLLDRVLFLKTLDALRQGRGETALSVRLRTGEPGAFRTAELRLTPVHEADGALRRIEIAGELEGDVTGTEGVGTERGAALAPAAEAPSFGTESAFLATVSHELRTPLNAIIGFSELLDGETFGAFADPRQKEYVGLIRRSGAHLLEVVNSLLDMSKIEAGAYELAMESFDIQAVAASAAEIVSCEAERKKLRLVLRTANGPERVTADRRACKQILVNLLGNAVKFTDEGTVCAGARIEGGMLVMEVSDTGIGIAPADISRLGKPFVQLSQGPSRRYEGTGIGLSLVRSLTELHHGTMEIASQPGRGTTVTVRIPLDCAERPRFGRTPPENVVALTNARQKASLSSQASPSRRSA